MEDGQETTTHLHLLLKEALLARPLGLQLLLLLQTQPVHDVQRFHLLLRKGTTHRRSRSESRAESRQAGSIAGTKRVRGCADGKLHARTATAATSTRRKKGGRKRNGAADALKCKAEANLRREFALGLGRHVDQRPRARLVLRDARRAHQRLRPAKAKSKQISRANMRAGRQGRKSRDHRRPHRQHIVRRCNTCTQARKGREKRAAMHTDLVAAQSVRLRTPQPRRTNSSR